MNYEILTVTPFAQNCTLLICPETKDAAIFDPGGDVESILAVIRKKGVNVTQILLTHGHIDHVGGVVELNEYLHVPVIGPHRDDAPLIEALAQQASMFGFPMVKTFTPDRWLEEGDSINVGTRRLEVYHCPGHAPGHVIFFDRAARLAQVGDVLFNGGIGRTDLPGGDHASLLRSIRDKLWPLGDDVTFIPGHGAISTFCEERRSNPFVSDSILGPGR
ncbi:MBL fold metallo-hydrolase [Phytohalomonas tamaricis]|uniref:MBL fold metallo-hydrolase n=1 Tax=Phytohalomonas tamaricis TaxID=2081032 RepID=UPI000D0B5415|nr:MBL fold metallo-hydrolase [Phytohalomonas tamaricis]